MKTWMVCGLLLAGILETQAVAASEAWQLDPESGWRAVGEIPSQEEHPGLARLREAFAAGDSEDVAATMEAMKREHPELVGGDADAFLEAERIYAKGNLGKAGKLYKVFLDKWPDSIYQPAAMERYFSIGAAFLQGQKRVFLKILRLPAFDDGVTIMRDIADKSGNSPIALRALQVTAENQERKKKFIDAYHTWSEISIRWPTGTEGRDALLRMARALHASYGGADFDVTVLDGARSYFEDFRMRYPEMAEDLKISDTLHLITEQAAYKQYETGFYYERVGNLEAAKLHYDKVQAEWPDADAAQMVTARLEPEAPPAVKLTLRRRMFNACGVFLDNWFGFKLIFRGNEKVE